jgi:hypothetical protein
MRVARWVRRAVPGLSTARRHPSSPGWRPPPESARPTHGRLSTPVRLGQMPTRAVRGEMTSLAASDAHRRALKQSKAAVLDNLTATGQDWQPRTR